MELSNCFCPSVSQSVPKIQNKLAEVFRGFIVNTTMSILLLMYLTPIKGVLFAVFAATYYCQFIGSTPLKFTHDDVLALRHNTQCME